MNLMAVFSNRLELLQYYFSFRDRKHRHRHNSDYQKLVWCTYWFQLPWFGGLQSPGFKFYLRHWFICLYVNKFNEVWDDPCWCPCLWKKICIWQEEDMLISVQKVTNINSLTKCIKIPNPMHKILWVMFC